MTETDHETFAVPDRLRAWLTRAVESGASDLHLVAGYPPVLRLHGDLIKLDQPPLSGEEVCRLVAPLCPADALARLESRKNIDLSFELAAGGASHRFRANLF